MTKTKSFLKFHIWKRIWICITIILIHPAKFYAQIEIIFDFGVVCIGHIAQNINMDRIENYI